MIKEQVKEHIIARRRQNPGMGRVELDGMNLLDETFELSRGLMYDFVWFIYLREAVGIHLTPDEQGEVSFFCPPELRGPAWDRYEKSFLDWRDNVFFAPDGVEAMWFNNSKGMLVITLLLGHGMYYIGINTIERNNGPNTKVASRREESLLKVLEWLADQLEILSEYVRKGWYPAIQLPVEITPHGDRIAYMPPEPGPRVFFNPLKER